ncbi:hypothetical protein AVV29_gp032 [Vibrio phage phi 3]|uniref:Uncharacterized protein n=1 Tax=Vibrio phage phi 3 TaxID=1589298 RepID=A0A0B5HE53_9CAUD|nr:hypothetical protein AVV29_gp032 [Vibrio phage phi 3]AJF40800.1 hypothetical protein SBVP3_0032 [Vibrio phage phi 3]
MKVLSKVILAVTLVISSGLAMANTNQGGCATRINGISGLDAQTKQTMIVACEQAKLSSPETPQTDVTVEKISKYAEASKGFAEALGVAARELGVATNEFIATPAGKLTVGIVMWKVLGEDIQAWVSFLLFIIIGGVATRALVNKVSIDHYEEATKVSRIFGTTTKKYPVYISFKQAYDFQSFMMWFPYVLYLLAILTFGINVF